MAGEFDDLIPGTRMAPPSPGEFDDLIPATPTPEEQRRERLRKLARVALNNRNPGASDLFSDAFTLGLQKPVGGLAGALGGELGELFGGEPATFGERYQAGTQAYQQMLDEAAANSGWGGTAANIAGGITSGGPVRAAVAKVPGALRTAAQAAGLGAVEGAARGSEDVGSALAGAVGGGVAAGGTAGLLGGLTRLRGFKARRAAREAARGTPPSVLKDQSRALFKKLDDAGVAYSDKQATEFADEALRDIFDKGYDPEGVHASLKGVVGRIEDLRGKPVSLEKLQRIREQLGSNAGANEPQVRRIAGRLLSTLDGFVSNVDPPLSALPGSSVGPTWREARRLWRAASTAEDIGWRMSKAERRAASTDSGQNVENALRQNIRQVLDRAEKPGRFNPYSPAELAQMERVVEGTPGQNILREYGKRFGSPGPLGGVQGTTLGTAGGLVSHFLMGQEPSTALLAGAGLGAGLYGTGRAARAASARMAENEADKLMRLITTGSLGPLQVPAGPPTREALARLLMQRFAQQEAPVRLGLGASSYLTGP